MKLAVTFASALAIHAAAAAGVAALGHPLGTSEKPDVFGRTIEIDEEVAAPVVHEEAPAPVARTSVEKQVSRGSQRAPSVVSHASAAPAATTSDSAPDPVPTETPAATPIEPVRFKMTMGSQGSTGARVAANGAGTTADVVAEGDVSERARQVGGASPRYPAEAIAQGVELGAPIPFEIVVDADGRVVSARALQHAGYGFDEAAIAALRTYRFAPAKRNGHAVAVRMKWTVDFRFD